MADGTSGLTLFLVRHGETAWSRSGQHTGRTDVPLTEEGRQSARLVGDRLASLGAGFALVLTSPLARARDTCALAGFGEQAQVSDDLREWDYGDYEGRTTTEVRTTRPGWSLWSDGVPGGETLAEVGRRADRVLAQAEAVAAAGEAAAGEAAAGAPGGEAADGAPGGDQRVLLFAHGHILRVVAARWLGLAPDAGRLFALSAGAISVLGHEREQPVVQRWNDDGRLVG